MKKSVYIFLCMILGAVLFLVIQRSAVFLYYLLLNNSTGFDQLFGAQFALIDAATLVIFLILGLWYGSYLGIHWYALIYGPKPVGKKTVAPARDSWDFDDLIKQQGRKPLPPRKTIIKSTIKVEENSARPKKIVRRRPAKAAKPAV